MADTRNQPGHGNQEQQGGQGGRGSELDRDRQPNTERGDVGDSERQAGQNPRRSGQEESGTTRTDSERSTEKNPGRQNAG